MPQRRFYDPHLPQTLVIAQILLYMNAVFGGIAILQVGLGSFAYPTIGKILLATSVATQALGAYGIANGKKIGYQIAVLAAFMPIISRLVSVLLIRASIVRHLWFIVLGDNILNALFQFALIALLLHRDSHDHQRLWFD